MIAIVDYGIGNSGSIFNMLKKIGAVPIITSDPEVISNATKIILPGVGHFDRAAENIEEYGLREVLEKKALIEKTPILGICLGMQLLTDGSEEGKLPGLGWIPAYCNKFNFGSGSSLKIPHMGWNNVVVSNRSSLTNGFTDQFRFYFVHSYYVCVKNDEHSILKTEYGIFFDSAIQKGNIFGTQFHPEKSHKFGLKLLYNFTQI